MDLIVNEEEAAWVRELFYKVVHEGASGYALAEMLNNRGLRTRAGAKFQSSNILRIIRHEGYTGYIITKNARSEYISELQIIDQETFEKANDIISRRSAKTAQDRRIAHTSQNPTLLAGIVYCAHCGAKMSGFIITMLFGGGLIPAYLSVRFTGLIDTIWALILPCAVPVYNVILFQNFVKALPEEILESAYMDGAGEWTVLLRMVLPLSKPVLATLTLFVAVGHWNAWFDGMIYMNDPARYPLQTYLQTIVVQLNLKSITNISQVTKISEQNSKCAQIIIAMLPILAVYPFLQKYFTKGIVLGSVKG